MNGRKSSVRSTTHQHNMTTHTTCRLTRYTHLHSLPLCVIVLLPLLVCVQVSPVTWTVLSLIFLFLSFAACMCYRRRDRLFRSSGSHTSRANVLHEIRSVMENTINMNSPSNQPPQPLQHTRVLCDTTATGSSSLTIRPATSSLLTSTSPSALGLSSRTRLSTPLAPPNSAVTPQHADNMQEQQQVRDTHNKHEQRERQEKGGGRLKRDRCMCVVLLSSCLPRLPPVC